MILTPKKSADPAFARIMQYYLDGFKRERNAEVNTVLIGSRIALATFPGEFFVEHGLHLKESSVIKNTFFVGYTNGAVGRFSNQFRRRRGLRSDQCNGRRSRELASGWSMTC